MMHDFAGADSDADPATQHRTTDVDRLDGIDESFVFDFEALDEPDDEGQRWSTWLSVEPLCRGPEPRPDWVVTSQAAVDTELGILKTGKEAEVFLVERGVPGGESVVMAAKRYKSREHTSFHRSGAYTEGWSTKRSRDARAVKAKSSFGREVASGQWANSEWTALKRFWEAGVPVPYPVQIDGTEILMEFISVDGEPAPRLAQTRPAADRWSTGSSSCDRRWGAGPRRCRPWRPLAVQHPRRGRAAGDHRPAAGRGPGRQRPGHGLPDARLHQRVHLVPQEGPRRRRARAVRGVARPGVLTRYGSRRGPL